MTREYLRQLAKEHGIMFMIAHVLAQATTNPAEIIEAIRKDKE